MILPHWIAALAGLELTCFFIFGLSIATAIPESEVAVEAKAAPNRKSSLQAIAAQPRV
jgi:hypothetical protein